MADSKMHADEVPISQNLVETLVKTQFPAYAGLSISKVKSAGTDNALYRLGDEIVVRLPRIQSATLQIDKEHRWLPMLASQLPLAIPVPIAKGKPMADYPFAWSIYSWLAGTPAEITALDDLAQAAKSLAAFLHALQKIDTQDAPLAGEHNFERGVPLAERDTATRAAINSLTDMIDTDIAYKAWDEALAAPVWQSDPVWIHGDLQSGNLLAHNGTLRAVIDFGGLAIGDPACDLQVAWNLFTGTSREVFKATMNVDDAMWARGRGWALSIGVIALPYYKETNPVLAGIAQTAIEAVLTDYRKRHAYA